MQKVSPEHQVALVANMTSIPNINAELGTEIRLLTQAVFQKISDLLVAATLDNQVCIQLLGKHRQELFKRFGFSNNLQSWLTHINAKTIQEFAQQVSNKQARVRNQIFAIE